MLEMLTGSELEQAERPCCSNVLLSFNCAQCNFCVPCGAWPRSQPELQFATGHSQKKNTCWQDPQWADGNNCTSQGGGKENDFDVSWRWPVMKSDSCHLQDLKNNTRGWQSCPHFTCTPRLEGLLPCDHCSSVVACFTVHNWICFLYSKQSSDCLLREIFSPSFATVNF